MSEAGKSASRCTIAMSLSGAPAKPPKAPTNQSDGPFDVNFFDQMVLERDTPYTLTLRRRAADAPAKAAADCVPLENVLLTRWPDAVVDWNGEEPIL